MESTSIMDTRYPGWESKTRGRIQKAHVAAAQVKVIVGNSGREQVDGAKTLQVSVVDHAPRFAEESFDADHEGLRCRWLRRIDRYRVAYGVPCGADEHRLDVACAEVNGQGQQALWLHRHELRPLLCCVACVLLWWAAFQPSQKSHSEVSRRCVKSLVQLAVIS